MGIVGTKISQLTETTDLQSSDHFIIERGGIANPKVSYSTLVSELKTDMGLTSTDSPVFGTVKLSTLSDGRVPYHAGDSVGLVDGPITTDGTNIAVSGTVTATTAKLTNLTDGKVPYHVNDTTGLADTNVAYDSGTGNWNFGGSVGVKTSPSSTLHSGGSTALSCTTITSSTTAADYSTYFLDASSGEVILTLPSAPSCPGRIYNIVRAQAYPSAYNCIVACQSGQTINGESSVALNNNYDRITVQSNGSNWIIVGT